MKLSYKFGNKVSKHCPECGEKLELYIEKLEEKRMVKTTQILECSNCGYNKIFQIHKKSKKQIIIFEED